MKKVILALAIASVSFVACNSDEKAAETPKDSTAAPVETPAPAPATPDSNATAKPDSNAAATPSPAAPAAH